MRCFLKKLTPALTPLLVLIVLMGMTGCEQIKARRGIQAGTDAYRGEEYEKAIEHLEEAVQRSPGLATGWWNLAMSNLALFAPGLETNQNKRYANGALQALEEYLKLEPNDPEASKQLVNTYINSGQYEGALKFYEARLAKTPNDIASLTQMAEINAMAKNYDEAFSWYQKRIAAEPNADGKATAYYDIGRITFGRLHKKDDIKGIERAQIADAGVIALKQAIELRPKHEPSHRFLSLVLRQRALAHGASYARMADIALAETYRKQAEELMKAERAAAEKAAKENPAGEGDKPGEQKDGE